MQSRHIIHGAVRMPDGMDLISPDNLAHNTYQDTAPSKFTREFGDVLTEIRDHLTNEELLCVSLFKNSKKPQHNQIYRVFFRKHYGKELTSSAITHRKHRMLMVLRHVGALLRFKRDNNLDNFLREILTRKQFELLLLYERRLHAPEIATRLGIKRADSVHRRFLRVKTRLREQTHPLIKRYIELLLIVLTFSRKRPT